MDVEFEDRVVLVDIDLICKTQAVWRGAVTRKRLREVQREFLGTVREVEHNEEIQVSWAHGPLCVPSLTSKKKLRAAEAAWKRNQKHNITDKNKHSTCDGDETKPVGTWDPSSKDSAGQYLEVQPGARDKVHRGCVSTEEQEIVSKERRDSISTNRRENVHSEDKSASVKDTDSDQDEFYSVKDTQSDLHFEAHPGTQKETKPTEPPANQTEHKDKEDIVDSDEVREESEQPDTCEKMEKDEEDEFIKMLHEKKDQVGTEELETMRGHVAMELLWVQQAISSRKQYLRLKDQMTEAMATS